jgi:G:T/U-mismatch repair DNA glycosylase
MDFYYPNIRNDFWRIFGLIYFGDAGRFFTPDGKNFLEEDIRTFLIRTGLAIWDTAMEIIRHKGNASDKDMEVITAIDLPAILRQIPQCTAIALTGEKAMETLASLLGIKPPRIGEYAGAIVRERNLRIYRMPSTSRAYPKPVEYKAGIYRIMLQDLGLLNE